MICPFLHSLTLYSVLHIKPMHHLICCIELLLHLLRAFPYTNEDVCPFNILPTPFFFNPDSPDSLIDLHTTLRKHPYICLPL
ncbi:hypothetical protein BGX38DRAFT_1191760, partial [Terfezia claveryi]